jgi:hypothetical protein
MNEWDGLLRVPSNKIITVLSSVSDWGEREAGDGRAALLPYPGIIVIFIPGLGLSVLYC